MAVTALLGDNFLVLELLKYIVILEWYILHPVSTRLAATLAWVQTFFFSLRKV